MSERGRGRLIVGTLIAVVVGFIVGRVQFQRQNQTSSNSAGVSGLAKLRNEERAIPQVVSSSSSGSERLIDQEGTEGEMHEHAAVGITFIDLLFAALLARVLELSNTVYIAGISHLILSVTVIATSWIGYRNSSNRAREGIKFFNIAFFQFVIEICFLYVYWLLASTYEGRDSMLAPVSTSAAPEAAIMSVFFGFNCLWDQLALWRRRSKKYPAYDLGDDRPRRRLITFAVFILYIAGFSLVYLLNFSSLIGIVTIDLTLAAVAVIHRFLQGIPWSMKARYELKAR